MVSASLKRHGSPWVADDVEIENGRASTHSFFSPHSDLVVPPPLLSVVPMACNLSTDLCYSLCAIQMQQKFTPFIRSISHVSLT